MSPPPIAVREQIREEQFRAVWNQQLDAVFADVAPYYDRANSVASLGLWKSFLDAFMSTIEVHPGERVLDVCAGTNAVGIALLRREPTLEVHAMDRSMEMQAVGKARAEARGLHIEGVIGDVHNLPFPDATFDVVTLQYASRHLRIMDVTKEIQRVLKPGGHFHHSDMLRPGNKLVEELYYGYLRACLTFTAVIFRSGNAALNCRDYFISTLRMFYSADELSQMLRQVGFQEVASKTLLGGMLGFHRATKAP